MGIGLNSYLYLLTGVAWSQVPVTGYIYIVIQNGNSNIAQRYRLIGNSTGPEFDRYISGTDHNDIYPLTLWSRQAKNTEVIVRLMPQQGNTVEDYTVYFDFTNGSVTVSPKSHSCTTATQDGNNITFEFLSSC